MSTLLQPYAPHYWFYVVPHFESFLSNIELTQSQKEDAQVKKDNIGRCLHAKYYTGEYNSSNVVIVGSHGKCTAVRPPSDVDMLYILPVSVYQRINRLAGNKQSQLLQEIRTELLSRFPNTDISADGQVVEVPFSSFTFDVVPAFKYNSNYITCNTQNGGSWRETNPDAEYNEIHFLDLTCYNKATHLIKMLKVWKNQCGVNIKSILIEILACDFIKNWEHRYTSMLYYDWLIRDYFSYMLKFKNGTALIPGINEKIEIGDAWYSKCESAYSRALAACKNEYYNFATMAANEWKIIFGQQFPGI